ncbi:MAG: hypothetical protein P4K93_13790 [Terracidiphilus sp.]|nr:hypothetical protein [Terracidiphilus sp.]
MYKPSYGCGSVEDQSHRPALLSAFPDPLKNFVVRNASDAGKIPQSLNCFFHAPLVTALARHHVGDRSAASCYGEPLSLLDFSQNFGELGFGVEGANFGICRIYGWH